MVTKTDPETELAYDLEGTGTPVVFLHGLTFDRRTWRPIIDRLDGSVQSIAIDLPAHGDSGGKPADIADVTDRVHRLLESLGVDKPIVVGHSMSAAIAGLHAARYPTLGFVFVDQGTEVLPFAQMLHQVEPALRSPGFPQVWQKFEESLGLDLLPEPARSQALATHKVKQDVVLGYWDQVLRTDPAELQAWVDASMTPVTAPGLAVFGRPITEGERLRFDRLPDVRIEVWPGSGHFAYLVDPDRFAATLRQFVDHCVERSVPGSVPVN